MYTSLDTSVFGVVSLSVETSKERCGTRRLTPVLVFFEQETFFNKKESQSVPMVKR